MQIDTIVKQEPIVQSKIKLSGEDERVLKSSLKFTDETEVLRRLFELFNLFFDKFSVIKKNEEGKKEIYEQNQSLTKPETVISRIEEFYSNQNIQEFIKIVNDALRIVYNSNIEINTCVSNMIYCVFATFQPEFYEQSLIESLMEESKEGVGKFKIKMLPILDTQAKKG